MSERNQPGRLDDHLNSPDPRKLRRRLCQTHLPAPPGGDVAVWLPVGKARPLPHGYLPPDLVALETCGLPTVRRSMLLRELAIADLADMFASASADGHAYTVVSAYRSEQYQRDVFERFVERELEQGAADREEALARANRYSALPGYSEHQLGTVVDLSVAALDYALLPELGGLPEGRWLIDNAWRYGLLHSYPDGSRERTGYIYEPWHLRWIGRPLAALIHADGFMRDGAWRPSQPTLEEYLAAIQPDAC
jgi:LAS superfamily LD-carboxypeptidase LdcB